MYRQDQFYGPQEQRFAHQRLHGNQGGQGGGFRGYQSKPKSKLKDWERGGERGE